jgi:hypothetical protein
MVAADEVDYIVVNTRMVDVGRLQELDALCRSHDVQLVKLQLHLKPFHIAS